MAVYYTLLEGVKVNQRAKKCVLDVGREATSPHSTNIKLQASPATGCENYSSQVNTFISNLEATGSA